jgi:hypothetical protein
MVDNVVLSLDEVAKFKNPESSIQEVIIAPFARNKINGRERYFTHG